MPSGACRDRAWRDHPAVRDRCPGHPACRRDRRDGPDQDKSAVRVRGPKGAAAFRDAPEAALAGPALLWAEAAAGAVVRERLDSVAPPAARRAGRPGSGAQAASSARWPDAAAVAELKAGAGVAWASPERPADGEFRVQRSAEREAPVAVALRARSGEHREAAAPGDPSESGRAASSEFQGRPEPQDERAAGPPDEGSETQAGTASAGRQVDAPGPEARSASPDPSE